MQKGVFCAHPASAVELPSRAAGSDEDETLPKSDVSRLLLLGLGNDLLTDDAVGLLVARQLARELADNPFIDVRETTEMGLALLDFLVGYPTACLVDSIQTGKAVPGTVHEIDPSSLKQLSGGSPHFLGVTETLSLGRLLGLPMPEQVKIFAIEVADPFTLGTEMTPALQEALPRICRRVAWFARDSVPAAAG